MTTNKLRVTVEDLETGDKDSCEIWNDYVLITAGSCYLDNINNYPGTGTRVLTIKGMKP